MRPFTILACDDREESEWFRFLDQLLVSKSLVKTDLAKAEKIKLKTRIDAGATARLRKRGLLFEAADNSGVLDEFHPLVKLVKVPSLDEDQVSIECDRVVDVDLALFDVIKGSNVDILKGLELLEVLESRHGIRFGVKRLLTTLTKADLSLQSIAARESFLGVEHIGDQSWMSARNCLVCESEHGLGTLGDQLGQALCEKCGAPLTTLWARMYSWISQACKDGPYKMWRNVGENYSQINVNFGDTHFDASITDDIQRVVVELMSDLVAEEGALNEVKLSSISGEGRTKAIVVKAVGKGVEGISSRPCILKLFIPQSVQQDDGTSDEYVATVRGYRKLAREMQRYTDYVYPFSQGTRIESKLIVLDRPIAAVRYTFAGLLEGDRQLTTLGIAIGNDSSLKRIRTACVDALETLKVCRDQNRDVANWWKKSLRAAQKPTVIKLLGDDERHMRYSRKRDAVQTAIKKGNPSILSFIKNERLKRILNLCLAGEVTKLNLDSTAWGICHGDLNWDNILLFEGGSQVIDFGDARPLYRFSDHCMLEVQLLHRWPAQELPSQNLGTAQSQFNSKSEWYCAVNEFYSEPSNEPRDLKNTQLDLCLKTAYWIRRDATAFSEGEYLRCILEYALETVMHLSKWAESKQADAAPGDASEELHNRVREMRAWSGLFLQIALQATLNTKGNS